MRKLENDKTLKIPRPEDTTERSELKRLRENKIQQDLAHIKHRLKIRQNRGY